MTATCCSCLSLSAESSNRMIVTGPNGERKMYVEHASKSDLKGSATGYVYTSDGYGPGTMVKLDETYYVQPNDFAQFVNRGFESLLHPAYYAQDERGESGFYGNEGYGYRNGDVVYGGVNDENGYKHYEDYNKEVQEKKHGKEIESYDKEDSISDTKHFIQDGKYHGVKEEKNGEEGEKFTMKKNHKKGYKTTGFHNVYHKEEFKKDHVFFDETNDGGHHSKMGNKHETHESDGKDYKKTSNENSGRHHDEYHKKGSFRKGDFQSSAKGFRESEGNNKHYSDNVEYGRKQEKNFQNVFCRLLQTILKKSDKSC